ncbi:hypothetical protein [Halegenticoccus tardaugens]|uniref:hypothetical protein n=1 Tax=Halegenticoccus tardaugens TaxID=2071624 RepID=UPI00100A8813|nr:hypothetical protein [Halegenticoccus tardaugens]
MSVWFDVARVAAGLNVLFLLTLSYVWVRNYAELRSKHTLGLLLFALFLLAENALAFYFYLFDSTLSGWFATEVPRIAWQAMMALHVLETAGIAFLLWVTWD